MLFIIGLKKTTFNKRQKKRNIPSPNTRPYSAEGNLGNSKVGGDVF